MSDALVCDVSTWDDVVEDGDDVVEDGDELCSVEDAASELWLANKSIVAMVTAAGDF